jgi:hypothetical protein
MQHPGLEFLILFFFVKFLLIPHRDPFKRRPIDTTIVQVLFFVHFVQFFSWGVDKLFFPLAFDIDVELYAVRVIKALPLLFFEEEVRIGVDGDQAQSMGQDFVLHHTGILVHHHFIDCHGLNICNENSPNRVGNWGVYALDLQFQKVLLLLQDFYFQVLPELFEI